jgi:hypothetical protein
VKAPEIATESWRIVFRDGFAPILPTAGLRALAEALRTDDCRLAQGCTTTPPPLMCVERWPVEAGCGLAFCGVFECGGFCPSDQRADPKAVERHATVGAVEERFATYCFEADQRLGEPAACRLFLNWFDDTPRDEMRRELLAEVDRELARRQTEPVEAA